MDRQDSKNLKKRYLFWLYKTTKDALDKIERKFTQLEIDKFILKELKRLDKEGRLKKFIDEFETYIQNKERDGVALKYLPASASGMPGCPAGRSRELKPDYSFLDLKLKAIEKAIAKELGSKALEEIKLLYEMEMTERILKSTQH